MAVVSLGCTALLDHLRINDLMAGWQGWIAWSGHDVEFASLIHPSCNTGSGVLDKMRVIYRDKISTRNESETKHRKDGCRDGAVPAFSIIRNISEIHASILQETRKMVNFGRAGRSQMKIWWRIEELLTCKSLFRLC